MQLCAAGFDDQALCVELQGEGLSIQAVDPSKVGFLEGRARGAGHGSCFPSSLHSREFLALHLPTSQLAQVLRSLTTSPPQQLAGLRLSMGHGSGCLTLRATCISKHGLAQRSAYHIPLLDALSGEPCLASGWAATTSPTSVWGWPQTDTLLVFRAREGGSGRLVLHLPVRGAHHTAWHARRRELGGAHWR